MNMTLSYLQDDIGTRLLMKEGFDSQWPLFTRRKMESTKTELLPKDWNVPQELKDRLGGEVGRQRSMFAKGHLLVILHSPPKLDDFDRIGRFYLRRPDRTWVSTHGSGQDVLQDYLLEFQARLEVLEEEEFKAKTSTEYYEVMRHVSPLARTARNMHKAIQQAREFVPLSKDIINLRDLAYQNERMAELLYADARNSVEYVIARKAEDQAKSSHIMAVASHRLNVLAAFFFPLATLSGIFGVNLRHGLEPEPGSSFFPFIGMLLLGLLFGFILKTLISRP